MKHILAAPLALAATPALAASGPFFSLHNTNFVVLLAFILFLAVLVYFKVPGMIGGLLDRRAEGIKAELDEARALREEAQTILASYERKQQDVAEQAAQIVEHAKREAEVAAEVAKKDLKDSIARRLASADDHIASAEAAAIKDVRDAAIAVAIGAAKDIIAKQMSAAEGNKLIEDAIADVEAKLH
ncbi:F0F1 ATP synthase subunit B [Maritimibacter fusiformis]|jgi:F-type H+-transporting ATPase subunit b|uniref:ATP synthase subunit b n=1 Tax=Maritimibacter fusiformis TaxID=2603819 RepID=A0A5D0RIN6_9RHOB|nr:F0F1 ATP synthase subunit B [Maritimibacter fusiformis]TYB80655.1 F0F1 ATP synthase subunit B [Maritimibacter fusiformis]